MSGGAIAVGRKSNRKSLYLAIGFGLVSAILILAYLRQTKSDGGSAGVATVPVVFAVRDIPERTQIKEGMLEVRNISADARHNLALSEKNLAVGQITRVHIAQGEQLLKNKIADQVRDVGFSAGIPEGKRAVAVGVTEVIASGGHIAPGDFVDVIAVIEVYTSATPGTGNNALTGTDKGDKPKLFTAATILQNVQVLAVASKSDQTLQTGGDKKVSTGPGQDEAKSVTLAVSPEQAEKLFLTEELGKIRLSLRPFGDSDQRQISPVTNSLGELISP